MVNSKEKSGKKGSGHGGPVFDADDDFDLNGGGKGILGFKRGGAKKGNKGQGGPSGNNKGGGGGKGSSSSSSSSSSMFGGKGNGAPPVGSGGGKDAQVNMN